VNKVNVLSFWSRLLRKYFEGAFRVHHADSENEQTATLPVHSHYLHGGLEKPLRSTSEEDGSKTTTH